MPVVVRQRTGLPTWLLLLFCGVAALLLFGVLDARRRRSEVPSVAARPIDSEGLASPLPPLAIPVELPPQLTSAELPIAAPPQPVATPAPLHAPVFSNLAPSQSPLPTVNRATDQSRPTVSTGSAVIVDNSSPPDPNGTARGTNAAGALTGSAGSTAGGARVRASMLANRTTTVPQGTLIPAVLETGFDSTRPGYARAVVSHDVRGFDGQRVLVPRGSRLIGEYQGDPRLGQKRALIIWDRLIRPDGATIELASPAADTVGRGGIQAQVNSHFLERFSGAILQSALNAGVALASRSADSAVIVALPNGGANVSNVIQPTNIAPTLKVKPGTSISVFVARDLDFTDVEALP